MATDAEFDEATQELATELAEERGRLREELETAWLRGWQTAFMEVGKTSNVGEPSGWARNAAADYAERVVGGSTRPERPGVGG